MYRGKPFKSDTGIVYLNIADFLKTINKERDIDKTMDLLSDELEIRVVPSAGVPAGPKDTKVLVSPETTPNQDVVDSLENDEYPELE